MKKFSQIIIILSSFCIVISNILVLMNIGTIAEKASAVSFIGLGIGAILLGIWTLKEKEDESI